MNLSLIKSYAKINLSLGVIKKTNSGYHKIESLISFLKIYDEIKIKKINKKNHKVEFFGKFSKGIGKYNTVTKLLDVLDKKKCLRNQKYLIKIKKNIPQKSGLGGGSMNASTIIRYLKNKKIIKLKNNELVKIANLVGSDVVLGLKKNNSILFSNGDILRVKHRLSLYVLIVKPNFGCSTKSIYSGVKKFEKAKFNNSNKNMFNKEFLKKMHNSLEPIAFSKYPKLEKIKSYLEKLTSPLFVRMSGSGSAIVAYFQTKKECDKAMTQFRKEYKKYWCISSKTI